MNANDVLKYGHDTVIQAIDGLTDAQWRAPGVCGVWTAKDVVAHLAAVELLIVEVLTTQVGGGPTPYLDAFKRKEPDLNDKEVARRRDWPVERTVAEYTDAAKRAMDLAARIPADVFRRTGTLSWYGEEYSLDDFVVYFSYGHKTEHAAQIAVLRDRDKARG
jgi:uncharacterized protein (TIGR03083 family)